MEELNEMTSSSSDKEKSPFSLTSFLFGNVDSDGNLENDVLDETSKRHLSSLSELGFKCLLAEIVGSEETRYNDDISSIEDDDIMSDSFDEKLPCAVDFSDITELASETDSQTSSYEGSANFSPDSSVNSSSNSILVPLLSEDNQSKKKLDTPLAGILPPKYADVDVRELFPEFSPNKVLRFSRLFGSGKSSSSRWKLVRKRIKRKKPLDQDISDVDESNMHLYKKGWVLNVASPPPVSELSTNDEDKFLKPETYEQQQDKENENSDNLDLGPRAADWRFGPAQLWYDMLNVPENGEGFDYGFKVTTAADIKESQIPIDLDYPDEAFLMISQANWESDVIWNGEEIKHKVLHRLNSRMNAAGWIPTSSNRIAQNFSQSGKGLASSTLGSTFGGANRGLSTNWMNTTSSKSGRHSKQAQPNLDDNADDMLYSIFPVQNEELTYGLWEDEIIWDAQAIRQVPKPKILTLDPNDENIILGIPSDVDPAKQRSDSTTPVKVKIAHPHVKKSKILLGKAGVINVLEEDAPLSPAKSPDHDPFNVSNDKYYMSKSAETSLRISSANLIQHSTPVIELRAPFVQTHMGPMRLRNFHRPSIKRYSHGVLAQPHKHCVTPLAKYIKKKAKQRENERIAAGGGDIFFMRTAEDLTGRDADLILVEFSEEHPPLVNLVGMCSKIKNYYKRKAAKDQGPQEYKYGEVAYAHTSPFLGMLAPGKSIQTLENNMYRVPIFEHEPCETDFLVIRTRNQYFIREFNGLFVAGQLCPLYEVPSPNSKRANNFVRDFLQVFIYRLFWKSKSVPRRLCMDEVKKAFPSHSESSIRKRLKLCADFKRTGTDSNLWVIKPDFRLPPEDEIRAMVSPEQCCAHFSMMAAEQRLKDAGYGEKFLFTPQEEDDDDLQLKMDDEIKVAPWNTTRAYIQAMKGKCLLQLTGPADPTGCGEGFSYVRVPNKPITRQNKEEHKSQPKRIVTGTDADLRRLSLNNAKALLRKCGIAEEEIKKLSRWEVIDVVRTLSTEKAKAGEEGMTKFSRGNRFSIAEHQERYKEECQRIFDLQNKVLSSNEILSTDEDESTDEENDSDIEEMGKNIENMLSNKKTSSQLTREREEQERQQLRKLFIEDSFSATTDKKDNKKKLDDENGIGSSQAAQMGRVLKIYRTFRDPEGKEYTRLEVVRKPAVIDAYQKIRNTKDEEFIKNFALLDDAQKEEMKREKRRIQEQLRRIKRNQIKEGKVGQFNFDFLQRTKLANIRSEQSNSAMTSSGTVIIKHRSDRPSSIFHHKDATSAHTSSPVPPIRRRPKPMKPDLKVRCGACGATGHMRTNKACPKFSLTAPMAPVVVALTQEEEDEFAKQLNDNAENLVNVEGTKLTLSSRLIKHAEDVKKRSLKLKVPKQFLHNARKRKAAGTDDFCDYLKKHKKPAVRRCTDPVVDMSTIFESILNEMRQPDDVQPFLFPVNAKAVPDYYKIVQRPMDLQTMRKNLLEKKYQTREEFLADVNQIVENSTIYNGAKSILTLAAENMLKLCVERLAENEDRLMHLEKTINPLLDDNDQVALSFILASILNKIKTMSESWPFLKPVNKRMVKDYYEIVKRPVDLQTIHNNIVGHKYHSRYEFLNDVELIAKNCLLYNGGTSTFTGHAQTIFKFAQSSIAEYDDYLQTLEDKLKVTRNRVIQQRAQEESMSDDASMHDFSSSIAIASDSPDNINNSSEMTKEIQLEADIKDFVKTETHQLLEDDLHCSSEDEDEEDLMEEVKGLEQLEVGIGPDFESQQVAEAMMQLGNFAYNTSTSSEEKQQPITTKWLPENSEEDTKMLAELSSSNPVIGNLNPTKQDLEISESDDDELLIPVEIKQESADTKSEQLENMDDKDGLWF